MADGEAKTAERKDKDQATAPESSTSTPTTAEPPKAEPPKAEPDAAASSTEPATADTLIEPLAAEPTGIDPVDEVGSIEPDNDATSQSDSAYAEPAGSLTASLTSSILNHTYENGRRYHAYDAGEYIFPNDDKEQDRLDLMHHIFKLILNGKLHVAPITNVQRVLDFGTGTGIWAIDFADEFPAAEVIGTDLSPIQPTWVPPNCHFFVDNVESLWTYSSTGSFDFIHGRAMSGSIKDWPKLFSQAYSYIKPGGWIEMQDFEGSVQSDDGTLKNAKYLSEWQEKINEASSKFEKKLDVAGMYKQHLIDAGFVDVKDKIYKVPIGPWPKDKKEKEIGRYELANILDAVEPYTLGLFTRILGWDLTRVQVLMAGVRADFRNPRHHIYSNFRFVYGRKPEAA